MSIQRMCELTGVSRASFYRDWEQKAPREAETALRDAIQRTALAHRDADIGGSHRCCSVPGS